MSGSDTYYAANEVRDAIKDLTRQLKILNQILLEMAAHQGALGSGGAYARRYDDFLNDIQS
jgi:hypothetical protein